MAAYLLLSLRLLVLLSNILLSLKQLQMTEIKFGTDGWRAIIAKEYTVENVKRVAEATARWMQLKGMKKVVIGYDTRFAGKMFAEATAQVMSNFDIEVILSHNFVSTPMVSLAVVKYQCDMGIVITASHNPPAYNGFKLKSSYGGPTIPSDIAEIEAIIPDNAIGRLPDIQQLVENGQVTYHNLEDLYINHVLQNFDIEAIKNSNIGLVYDAMYGAGQNVIKRLLPDATFLHCTYNPSFMGQAPEPISRNLTELEQLIKSDVRYNLGLANDGDADRIGLYDEDGQFVDSHHILLLLLMYLHEYKGMDGKVVITFSVTNKMKKLAEMYGLDSEVTKIGFKYIAEIMIDEDVLVGGEESGGLAVKGHIPERDGIWIGLVIMEYMAKKGKTLKQLIQEIYDKVGSFSFDRDDLHLTNQQKSDAIKHCESGLLNSIAGTEISSSDNLDGYKYFLPHDEWVLLRPSGTEPVLRVYAQADSPQRVRELLDGVRKELNI